jgi:hypothetical protein
MSSPARALFSQLEKALNAAKVVKLVSNATTACSRLPDLLPWSEVPEKVPSRVMWCRASNPCRYSAQRTAYRVPGHRTLRRSRTILPESFPLYLAYVVLRHDPCG